MSLLRVSSLSALILAAATAASAGEAPRVVVELFTSQGCSSCPPADRLLGELATSPDIVALSLPVDYWDYLGWKDTLAERAFTARQKGYGEARGDRHVYTPQAVINGAAHVVGSDANAIERASREASGKAWVRLDATQEGGSIRIAVPQGAAPEGGATVYLLPVRRHSDVDIRRGENSGRKATYVNVVRGIIPVGTWTGEAASFTAPAQLAKQRDADTFVAILQAGPQDRPGQILGAAKGPGL